MAGERQNKSLFQKTALLLFSESVKIRYERKDSSVVLKFLLHLKRVNGAVYVHDNTVNLFENVEKI